MTQTLKTVDFKMYYHAVQGDCDNDFVLNGTFDPLWNISNLNLDQKCTFERIEIGSKVE